MNNYHVVQNLFNMKLESLKLLDGKIGRPLHKVGVGKDFHLSKT